MTYINSAQNTHTEVQFHGCTIIIPRPVRHLIVKAGISCHLIDGDYVDLNDPGLLVAIGIDFSRDSRVVYSVEIAVGTAEAMFNRYYAEDETLRTYDTIVSFILKF